MFSLHRSAFTFLFGRKPEESMYNDKGSACGTPNSNQKAEESVGEGEKQCSSITSEYYALSKKRRYALEELVPLVSLGEGQKGKIVVAIGGRKLISRLCDLGLIPGTQIIVLKKGLMEGPIILDVRSCEIAIGSEIASKVLVKPL